MKNPLVMIKNQFTEVKGRTLLIVIVLAVIILVAVFFIFSPGGGIMRVNKTPGSSALRAPNIESTPGVGKIQDQAYIELQRQANQQHAQEAITKGQSAVATVTNDQFVNQLSIPESGIASIGKKPAAAQPEQQETLAEYQRLYQEQLAREKQQEQERLRLETLKQQEVYQDAYEGLMLAAAKGMLKDWAPPSQTYVKTEAPSEGGRGGAGGGNEQGNPGLPPIYKAGDIIFGVMETSVNSDEPGPVMVKIVSGPLAGGKLIGSFKRVEDQVFLEFSLLNAPEMAHSLPVKIIAIDPETARTALASNVDYHRLLRYGSLFASSFLQGVGEAVLAGIQPEFIATDTSFTVTDISVSTKDQVLVGLGEVGTKLGEKMDPIFDTPPTVTVDSGTAVGLLFLEDFSLEPGSTATPITVVHEEPTTPTAMTAGQSATVQNAAQNAATAQPTNMVTK